MIWKGNKEVELKLTLAQIGKYETGAVPGTCTSNRSCPVGFEDLF